MQQHRRGFLTIAILVTMAVTLMGQLGVAGAGTIRGWREPSMPVVQPPSNGREPNTGEPDSGSTLRQRVNPNLRGRETGSAHPLRFSSLEIARWTTMVWAKRTLGIGG